MITRNTITYFGIGVGLQTDFGSTHVVEQLLFSINPSILTFDFDLILGLLLTSWGPYGLFLGSKWGAKPVIGSTHVVKQLPFNLFLSILTFDFDLILGVIFDFMGP